MNVKPKSTPRRVLTLWSVLAAALWLCAPGALAQRESSMAGLDRMEETLQPLAEAGRLAPSRVGPVLLVGAKPAYERTGTWFPAAATAAAVRVFGHGYVRVCEACMNPTVHAANGKLEYSSAHTLPMLARLDDELRGQGAPAKTALWIDETPTGVAVRIVALGSGQVLYAGHFDDRMTQQAQTADVYKSSTELSRRLRGESLTHIVTDLGITPNPRLSFDVLEQFGAHNEHLAGVTFSFGAPVLGVGASYHYVMSGLWNLSLGGQVLLSIPEGVVAAIPDADVSTGLDPLWTGVLVARWPIPQTSFALNATATTSGSFAVGISMLDTSILPFLPFVP